MSNLTVSSAVDTFMQAGNQAAMRAALGGTGPLAQYVAFLASYGDDSTGMVGDPTHPFLTAQAAYDAVVAASGWSGLAGCPIYFQVLSGAQISAGNITLGNYSHTIYVGGWSAAFCVFGVFTAAAGYSLTLIGNGKDLVQASASVAGPATLSVYGVTGEFVADGVNGAPGEDGGASGSLVIEGCNVSGLSATGGTGGSSASGATPFSLTIEYSAGAPFQLTLDTSGWDGNVTYINISSPSGETDTYEFNGGLNFQIGSGFSYVSGLTIYGDSIGSGYSYDTDYQSNIDYQIAFSDGNGSNWDGNPVNITISGPGAIGTQIVTWGGGGSATFTGSSGVQLGNVIGETNVTGFYPGSGYSYSSDGGSNIGISFTDGTGTGTLGGAGSQVAIKRSRVTAADAVIRAGIGSYGAPGVAAPRPVAYFSELDTAGVLSTSDPTPLTATERGCIEAGTFIADQS